jgi:CheY-like chemotaxis protein
MPLMDGWEFLEIFERDFPQFAERTKVYILSSSINPNDKDRAITEKGVCGFVEKPLDFNQINRLKKELELS